MWAYINENQKELKVWSHKNIYEIHVRSQVSGSADGIELLDLWSLPGNAICTTCEFFLHQNKCSNIIFLIKKEENCSCGSHYTNNLTDENFWELFRPEIISVSRSITVWKNNNIRVCADFLAKVNEGLYLSHIRNNPQNISSLNERFLFKINLSDVYLQIELDEQCKKLTVKIQMSIQF